MTTAIQLFNDPATQPFYMEGKLLKKTNTTKVFSHVQGRKALPKNQTDTIKFGRLVPSSADAYGVSNMSASAALMAEGVGSNPRTISYEFVTAVVREYGTLFQLSSKTHDMSQMSVVDDMLELCGEDIATIQEMVRFGAARAGSSVQFSNGASRGAVNTVFTLTRIQACVRQLYRAAGKTFTPTEKSSENYGSKSVNNGYIAICHPDLIPAFRLLTDFRLVADYGPHVKPICDTEVGAIDDIRVIVSEQVRPNLGAGAAAGASIQTTASNADVYEVLIFAQEAFHAVGLGMSGKSTNAIRPTYIPVGEKSKADPQGRFGFIGANWYDCALPTNDRWMVRLETAAPSLA